MGRQRQRVHDQKLLKLHNVVEMGQVAAFMDPKESVVGNISVEYDKEYQAFAIYATPMYYSVHEVIEEIESQF